MEIIATSIPDVKLIKPARHGDHRGFFSETYNRDLLAKHGIDVSFMQDNHSLTERKGTLRGLHFQSPPFAQTKLVRVVRGAVLDVVVDLRERSPTFGQHVKVELSAENWQQILVPAGFAHGFLTLVDGVEVTYKVDAPYSARHDSGIRWNDPDLGIDWPVTAEDVILSAKDERQPSFADRLACFA
ncbi:MAG: dTDP-4-dehydrorhamnose 3,5-epimerase [Geminicoccaceae bacterium]|nr:dTDP-4-dehydrorhamnose 3,5-epimerase [Geminicoccaceae bacterium]